MTRRELAKFLTLGSGLLAGVNVLIAFIGLNARIPTTPIQRIAGTDDIPPGGSLLFRYPTADDPCILVRDVVGQARRVLAGLHASVVRGRAPAGRAGARVSVPQGIVFVQPTASRSPDRRRGACRASCSSSAATRSWRSASRSEMETRQQGSTLFSAVLVLIAILVVIQLWLVAAAVDALMARQTDGAGADRHRFDRAARR